MELLLATLMGVGLSAACGFRVFVPFLVISIGAKAEFIELGEGFQWMTTNVALITFAVATLLEVFSYFIPWVDQALDTIATPTAVVAGSVISASLITDMNPLLTWVLAAIVGGGTATSTQLLTASARGVSTVSTGGLGNPVVSLIENISSMIISVLAILMPILTGVLIIIMLFILYKLIQSFRKKMRRAV
ncbi:DUF4126 domain-containing protein [Hazenella coriacea]|uniref:Uncharacterized protein DUF4126 n=1 Tax=Hazenella coriacea TaxID=1179467 RepID=A0A4R3LB24_9BACL|nr:DUF4126 domain-containing protein [Hazenella coriacea]TCS94716.1 uncharacterized protein DUF4126 [Hazenella coriacea]